MAKREYLKIPVANNMYPRIKENQNKRAKFDFESY